MDGFNMSVVSGSSTFLKSSGIAVVKFDFFFSILWHAKKLEIQIVNISTSGSKTARRAVSSTIATTRRGRIDSREKRTRRVFASGPFGVRQIIGRSAPYEYVVRPMARVKRVRGVVLGLVHLKKKNGMRCVLYCAARRGLGSNNKYATSKPIWRALDRRPSRKINTSARKINRTLFTNRANRKECTLACRFANAYVHTYWKNGGNRRRCVRLKTTCSEKK